MLFSPDERPHLETLRVLHARHAVFPLHCPHAPAPDRAVREQLGASLVAVALGWGHHAAGWVAFGLLLSPLAQLVRWTVVAAQRRAIASVVRGVALLFAALTALVGTSAFAARLRHDEGEIVSQVTAAPQPLGLALVVLAGGLAAWLDTRARLRTAVPLRALAAAAATQPWLVLGAALTTGGAPLVRSSATDGLGLLGALVAATWVGRRVGGR